MDDLVSQLAKCLPADRLKARLVDRYAYARDASFYRLIPRVVVQPRAEQEVVALFEFARTHGVPLVFRAAGTSLSGQAITDGILVEIGRHWRGYTIDGDGGTITLQPGIVGGHANQYLRHHGRKIGPDPASLNACYIGGIVANNASGMCCGVVHNAYHTLTAIRFILPSGLTFDTAETDADQKLATYAPEIHAGLSKLRERLLADEALSARIRDKYLRKNTMGYSLNAFLDYERPVDILAHLLVGSEGTLGFISRVTLATLPDPPCKSTALLLFPTLDAAAEAAHRLATAGAAALEIMDRASLRAVEREPGMPPELAELPPTAGGLLCEFQADDDAALDALVDQAAEALDGIDLAADAVFTTDAAKRLGYWQVRKGLFPAVGAVRQSGTTVIIEDICFRTADLAPVIADLQALFQKHKYYNAIIFGHAKDGNLHFVITQPFDDADGVARYEAFMADVVALTRGKYDGALKAEHGTGRNMAPFLETEWGPEAVAIMRELKRLIDPRGILNPGVILNDDARCHVQAVKALRPVSPTVDTCIECGFCEVWCPSRSLTTTPRRRIALAREIALLEHGSPDERAIAAELRRDYTYDAVDTCAVDGLCALGCPVHIDTGDLTRELRQVARGGLSRQVAGWSVKRFGWTVAGAKLGLKAGHGLAGLIGEERLTQLTLWLNRKTGRRLPVWQAWMPAPAKPLPPPRQGKEGNREEIVYVPSCLTRGLGHLPGEKRELSPTEAFMDLLREANIHARYPANLAEICCGQPYSSKGFADAARAMAERFTLALWEASERGRLPIVMDTSPCVYRVKTYDHLLTGAALKQWRQLRVLDVIEFLHDTLLERVMPTEQPVPVILHPTCSTVKMGLVDKMQALAEQCAARVYLPAAHGCCGFAGDRGFLIPELTEAATANEAREVETLPRAAACYSTCRTCEIGMASATGRPYSSIVYLVHDAVCQRSR